MKLYVVKKNSHLHWPEGLGEIAQRYRGPEGYVVDLDAPFESDAWCKGQEYKLEPAPEGAKPSEIKHPVALRMLKLRGQDAEKAERKAADAPKAPVGGDMPAVDVPRRQVAAKA